MVDLKPGQDVYYEVKPNKTAGALAYVPILGMSALFMHSFLVEEMTADEYKQAIKGQF